MYIIFYDVSSLITVHKRESQEMSEFHNNIFESYAMCPEELLFQKLLPINQKHKPF